MLAKLELVYCAAWHYTERAIRAMAEIMNDQTLERKIESFTLVPSDGGKFELSVNGTLLYSKLQTGKHVVDGQLKKILLKHLAG